MIYSHISEFLAYDVSENYVDYLRQKHKESIISYHVNPVDKMPYLGFLGAARSRRNPDKE